MADPCSESGVRKAVSDAMGVGQPGLNGLFDLFRGEIFGESATDQRRKFGVGGKAEGDELRQRKDLGGGGFCGGEQARIAEALFEADKAVLDALGIGAGFEAGEEQGGGDEDDPHAEGKAG